MEIKEEVKKKKKTKNYVDGVEFRNELIKSKELGEPTRKFSEMIMLMAEKIQAQFKYESEEDREDIRYSAILVVFEKWQEYDTSRPNAFAFFTRVIFNGLFASWNKYKKNNADTISLSIFEEDV